MRTSGRLRVAAAQMDVAWMDPESNVKKIVELVDAAADDGARIVVFPELVTSGYLVGRDAEFMRQYRKTAIAVPGEETRLIGEAARRRECVVVVGVMREHPVVPGSLCNSVVVFGPDGAISGVYDKTHIPSEEKHYFHQGTSLDVISTEEATIGCLICADNSFPEAARSLALQGADLVCVSYSRYRFPDATLYRSLVVARAYENQMPFVSANRVGRQEHGEDVLEFEGQSCIVGPHGDVLALADHDRECVISADLDFDAMADTRLWQTRFRDRRPDLYGVLSQPHIPLFSAGKAG